MRSWLSNWKKRRESRVEAELRAARPEASARLVKSIAARINPRPLPAVRTRTRIGVALAATACMVAVVGATGGFSFAASSVLGATHSVTHFVPPASKANGSALASNGPVRNAACTQYGSAPTISGFTPSQGGPGTTTVTVNGTNFSGLSEAGSVSVGGATATPHIVSSTQLTFVVPADATPGSGPITVTNCIDSAVSTDDFTVLAAPTASTVNPTSGGPGTPIEITGTNFVDGGTTVSINGVAMSISSLTSTTIDTTIPLKAAVKQDTDETITVTTDGGSATIDFTVVAAKVTVTGFTPNIGAQGTDVKVTGSGFWEGGTSAPTSLTDLSVQFGDGGSATPTSIDSDTTLHVAVPTDAKTGPITVVTQLAGGTSSKSFTFLGTPDIQSFPSAGKTLTKIVITGSSFTGATAVEFGSSDPAATATLAAHQITVTGDTKITATVPAGAVAGKLTVDTPHGNGTSTDDFTPFSTAPNPTGPVAPDNHGGYNAPVTITGDTLAGVTKITFNGTIQKDFTIVSDNEIDTTVPLKAKFGPGSGKTAGIVLTNAKGTGQLAFTVDDTAPKITKVTSDAGGKKTVSSGQEGDTIYLNGANLDGVTSVDIGDSTVAAADFGVGSSASQIILTIPAGIDTTTAPITANDSTTDTSGSSANFTVYRAPVVGGVPAYAAAAKPLVINGTNFQGIKTVTLTPDGGGTTFTVPAHATPKNTDGTSITLTVPGGKNGVVVGKAYKVTATLADGLSGDSGGSETLIVAKPAVTGVVQNGDNVEVDGSGFTGASSVTLVAASGAKAIAIAGYTFVNDGKITFTLSGDEPTGPVFVTNAAGSNAANTKAPVIGGPTVKTASVTVSSQAVKIGGTGLLGSNNTVSVTIDGHAATFTPGSTQKQTGITVVNTGPALAKKQVVTIVVTTDVGSITVSAKV